MAVKRDISTGTVMEVESKDDIDSDIFVVRKSSDVGTLFKITKDGIVEISSKGIQEEFYDVQLTASIKEHRIVNGTSMVKIDIDPNVNNNEGIVFLPKVSPGYSITFVIPENNKAFTIKPYSTAHYVNNDTYGFTVDATERMVQCAGISYNHWLCFSRDFSSQLTSTRAGKEFKANVNGKFLISNENNNGYVTINPANGRLELLTGNNGIDAELKIDSESNNLGFSIRSNNTDAVSFYSENKDQGTFMKFDSYANQVHIGSGTSINKTIINTESLDLSNQETAMELKSNKFYALEITNGPRETDSYLRVDTDNNEIVLGEGSNVNRLKFQSEFLDTSNQDTKIYIGHNSTSALNFVDGPASKSSFLKMGIDTITIGEGGGIDRTIISTNTLDITNVSIVELNALDIIDQNSNQRYIKMRNKEVIIGDDMAENSNFIRVKNDDVNMHSINTIGLNAVNSISIAAQNDINITSEKTVEIDGIALSNGNLKTNGNITVEAGDMVFTGSKTSTILHQSEGGKEDGLKIASVNGHVKVENIIFNKNNISGLSHLFIKGNDDPNLPQIPTITTIYYQYVVLMTLIS